MTTLLPRRISSSVLTGCVLAGLVAAGCTATPTVVRDPTSKAAHLATFDDLDFNVFSKQRWSELSRSHAHNVVVHWPDGHVTNGLHQHMEDLMAMFLWAPDTRITEHTVKIGDGDWTAVTGTMTGTFTRAMRFGQPNAIPATGKAYKIQMVTVAHWKDGVMDEEYLFWDNQEFNRQIGLTQ